MQGYVDSPVEGAPIAAGAVRVEGWAHDDESPVRRVSIYVDGIPAGRAGLTWPRPDVAEGLGDPRAGLTGFQRVVTLPPELRTPGSHVVRVEIELLDGRTVQPAAVRVELPEPPLLPADLTGPSVPTTAAPTHTVWLARALDQGGSQLRMAETVERLQSLGWTTTVLSPADGPLRARLEATGAEVRLVPAVPLDDPVAYRAAVSALTDELAGADLAVAPTVTSFPLVHAAALVGIPAVQRIGEEAPLPTVVSWLMGRLDTEVEAEARRAIGGAAAIWTNAHAVEATYRAQGYDGAWSVIGTGRPTVGALPSQAEARRSLGLPHDRRLLVSAGTVWAVKGQGLLAEAARVVRAEHPELLVALVGYDQNPYADRLRAHLAAHGLEDTVRIFPFHDDLTPWWAAADAVALTPHSPSEALSGALVEGMAHGLPALVTRAGDSPLMVEEGLTGWLADADDLGSLVEALRRFAATDPSALRTIGGRAAARVAREDDRDQALARVTALLGACVTMTGVA